MSDTRRHWKEHTGRGVDVGWSRAASGVTGRDVLDSHDHDLVVCVARGAYLRRSGMSRRVWRPAVNGNPHTRTGPVIEGMHFHDLRHTHKTWLSEDDIPESPKPNDSATAYRTALGLRSTNRTAPYRILGKEQFTCGFTGGRYWD